MWGRSGGRSDGSSNPRSNAPNTPATGVPSPHWQSSSGAVSGRPGARSAATPNGPSGRTSPSMPGGARKAGGRPCRRARKRLPLSSKRCPRSGRRPRCAATSPSIAIAHRAIGRGKTLKDPQVRLALQRMHRSKGRRQDQAQGLTWPLRQRLLEAAGDRPIDVQKPRPARGRLRRDAPALGAGVPASI